MQEDRYISASQLGRMLNLSRGTVYTMRKRGILPEGLKIGGVRRWRLLELKNFLEGRN